jgi:hypothetical protein
VTATKAAGRVRLCYRLDTLTAPEQTLTLDVPDADLIVLHVQPGYSVSWCVGRIAQHIGVHRARIILGDVEKVTP